MSNNNLLKLYLCPIINNMKKHLISLLIATTCSLCSAQNFKAGLNFGFTNTDVLGTDVIDNDVDFNKLGLTIGLYAQLPIGEKSHVGFEMNFIEKGAYYPFSLDSTGAPAAGSESFKLRLNYIEVPILYRHDFTFNVGKKTINGFSYEIGPSFGFLIYSDINFNQTGYDPVTTYTYPYTKYDISALGGIVYRFDDHWKLHIRYENSILPIHSHPSGAKAFNPFYLYPNVGEVNMVFSYLLSYTF